MAMASTNGSRVLLGEIDAAVNSLRVDALGNHYFEFENNGEGSLYFSGYRKALLCTRFKYAMIQVSGKKEQVVFSAALVSVLLW